MSKRALSVAAVAALVAALAGAAMADIATLKEQVGAGYTYSDTKDTVIDRTSSEKEYAHGGQPTIKLSGTTGGSRPAYYLALMGFDLAPLGPVMTVNSAKLRVYQYTGPGLGTLKVNQMTEDWSEGVAGSTPGVLYGKTFDGASCYARHPGTAVAKEALTAYDHGGTTLYWATVTDPTYDPSDGVGHYIRRDNSTTGQFRNWDIAGRKFTEESSLDNLVAAPADTSTNVHYYYDSAADRVYIRSNSYGFHYLKESDIWADSINAGGGSASALGPLDGSIDEANTYQTSTPIANWWEVDITPLATKWLVDGEANYGMRLVGTTYNGGSIVAADQTLRWDPVNSVWEGDPLYEKANGIYVQPELVVDFEPLLPVAEPAGLSLLGLALLGLTRRKRW